MSEIPNPSESNTGEPSSTAKPLTGVMLLPGLVAIALYMLVLAGVVIVGVAGGHYPPIFLLLGAGFLASGFFLVRLYRWAWASHAGGGSIACYLQYLDLCQPSCRRRNRSGAFESRVFPISHSDRGSGAAAVAG